MSFTPELFYEDVRQLFHNEVHLLHKDFYHEMINITKQRQLPIDSKDIDHRCHQLFKLLSKHGKFNLDKFEIYLSRNILENSIPSSNLTSALTLTSTTTTPSNELIKKQQQMATLRKKYLKLLAENQQIQHECEQKEQLVTQMNSALFKYRVGVQVLDRYEVTPLHESIEQLQQQASQLKLLTIQAEELVQEIHNSLESSNGIDISSSPPPQQQRQRQHSEGHLPPSHPLLSSTTCCRSI